MIFLIKSIPFNRWMMEKRRYRQVFPMDLVHAEREDKDLRVSTLLVGEREALTLVVWSQSEMLGAS
jgi:hypothetical protein